MTFTGLLACAAVLSLAVGAKAISLPELWDVLRGTGGEGATYVVSELRLPRTITGLAVGAALGTAGALIQAFSRNPLADPGILGVNAGAAFFVVLGIGYFGATSIDGYLWFALVGALATTLVVYTIGTAGRGGADPVRLVLGGVAIAAVLTGITTALMLLDPSTFDAMRSWNAGSLTGRGMDVISTVAPFLVVGALMAALVASPLNAVALGDELATGLGASVHRTRLGAVFAVTLLAGSATAVAGPIGFLGLMAPHIARWITGPSQPWIIVYSALIAPVILLTSDVIARVILPSGEVPVGVLTAFVGAPVLIALVRRPKASGL
ncbi:ABC transporter permease [Aeromicrobium sp. PE09-221]|nr:ABC transporter permease [Aeromicrobium sp. PE09-221]